MLRIRLVPQHSVSVRQEWLLLSSPPPFPVRVYEQRPPARPLPFLNGASSSGESCRWCSACCVRAEYPSFYERCPTVSSDACVQRGSTPPCTPRSEHCGEGAVCCCPFSPMRQRYALT